MPEGRGVHLEAHLFPSAGPAVAGDRLVETPLAAAIFIGAGYKLTIGAPIGLSGRPERLRFGTDKSVRAVALQLATMARIDKAVIGPGITDEGDGRHLAGVARSAT